MTVSPAPADELGFVVNVDTGPEPRTSNAGFWVRDSADLRVGAKLRDCGRGRSTVCTVQLVRGFVL